MKYVIFYQNGEHWISFFDDFEEMIVDIDEIYELGRKIMC